VIVEREEPHRSDQRVVNLSKIVIDRNAHNSQYQTRRMTLKTKKYEQANLTNLKNGLIEKTSMLVFTGEVQ
jgi:hypothetical protein